MATYARPSSDVSIGIWKNESNATTNLYASIDETTHSETDYITATIGSGGGGVVGGGLQGVSSAPQVYTTTTGAACHYVEIYGSDDNKAALVFYRDNFSQLVATNVLFWFHGATATETQLINNTFGLASGGNVLLDSWLDRGWIVIAPRLGSTGTAPSAKGQWGNGPMRDGCAFLYDWAKTNFTVSSKGFLFGGFSAGGTNSINALMTAKTLGHTVAAWAIIDPAINMRWFVDKQGGNIKTAYALPANQKTGSAAVGSISTDGLTITAHTMKGTGVESWVDSSTVSGGYAAGRFNVISGAGYGQVRTIVSNTATTVTLDAPLTGVDTMLTNPSNPTKFAICTPSWIPYVDEDSYGGHDGVIVDLARIPNIPIYISASYADNTVMQEFNADVFLWRLLNAGWQQTITPTTGPEVCFKQTTKDHGDSSHFNASTASPNEINPFFDRALA